MNVVRKTEKFLVSYGKHISIIMGVILVLTSLCIYGVSAINITADTGNNYIHYSWSGDNPVNVYINGVLYQENSTMNEVIIRDLGEGEKNKIVLIDTVSAEYGELEVYTEYKVLTPLVTGLFIAIMGMYVLALKLPIIAFAGIILNIFLVREIQTISNNPFMIFVSGFLIIVGLMAFGYGMRD